MGFAIRPYHPSDLTALYRICLLTGDVGNDASTLYSDPDLIGHFYAAPYALFEPELCFVLTLDEMPVGYVLGVRDSAEFAQTLEDHWFGPLRERYPLQIEGNRWTKDDRNIIRLIHNGLKDDVVAGYPAHLHIDILPVAQGGGWGRKLMHTLWDKLRELDVSAVYLGVGIGNQNAIGYYRHMGFHEIEGGDWGFLFGKHL